MKVPLPEHASTELGYEHPAYADPDSLDRELRRVGEICHQCRRCLPLCPSFPKLFELVDATDREIEGVTREGFDEVNELCFHCKLCYNHCPYTPDHEWDVDFPALMRRQQLARAGRDGVALTRKLTTRTDLIGRVSALAPALMNFANRNRLSRVVMEKTLGIHRDWVQPGYVRETVARWWRQRSRPAESGSGRPGAGGQDEAANGHVAFFTTCSVNYSDPETARAAVEVLERSGVRVDVVYERCCGMPFTDTGELDRARRNAERNVADLLPLVEAGATVVAPGPSCSLMLKREYPKLLDSDAARRVAESTQDLMEYLYHLARAKKLDRGFERPLGSVAYHAPCHLRAQNIGFRARDLLKLAGAEITLVDACSGVDGTWGMQARFHEASLQVAAPMLRRIEEAEADEISTDCPLSALRIEERLGRKALHPIRLLHRAYGMGPE
ncbi:MAG: heterodisulfide reductase-related iron-sulfur binding cluster [Myxococcota bacterium]|nr:heterodisulfide reductase-related iron-sulfur binding cluster [Myxococcota bacterium]